MTPSRYCCHLTAIGAALIIGLTSTAAAAFGDANDKLRIEAQPGRSDHVSTAVETIHDGLSGETSRDGDVHSFTNGGSSAVGGDHVRALVKRSNLRKVFLGRKRDAELAGVSNGLAGNGLERMQLKSMLSGLQTSDSYHKRPRPFLGKRTPCQMAPSWVSNVDDDGLGGAEDEIAADRFLNEDKRPHSKPFLGKRSSTGNGCDELIDFSQEM